MLNTRLSQRPGPRQQPLAFSGSNIKSTSTISCPQEPKSHLARKYQLDASRIFYSTDATSTFATSALAAAVAVSAFLNSQPAYALPQDRLEQIQQQIEKDFSEGQYYVTGKLTPALYDEQCTFKDPTTNVKGVKPYTTAVASLFDPAVSKADLISSTVSGPNSITLKWRLEGRLKYGNLDIKPYTGTTVYTVDESSGLITKHTETWDISALDALVSTVIPSFGAPPAPPITSR